MKLWKWAGWGHNPPVLTPDTPHGGPAKLATFCSTCPQPGINLPDNWQEDPNKRVIPLNAQHLQIIHIDFLQGSIYPAVRGQRQLYHNPSGAPQRRIRCLVNKRQALHDGDISV
jgi:hypothetical protein